MPAPDERVTIDGLPEFRARLRAAGAALPAEMRKAEKEIAVEAASRARSLAGSGTRQQSKMAGAIAPRASAAVGAAVAINNSKSWPFANAAFWGAKRRTGWNAKNTDSRPQFPKWIGTGWEPGVAGQGPYAINDALAAYRAEMEARYLQVMDRIGALAGFK